ncbi:MAG: hypothetical protein AB1324_00875 [Candidatus Micrarchaeota archaeon]
MLPNVYKGDYRLLAIPPILLLIASLAFIPSIRLGVDFQGGTVITLSLSENLDAEELTEALRGEGLEASVRVFDTAVGYRAEIEIPQSDELVQADSLKGKFNTLLPEVTALEISSAGNSSASGDYAAKKAELEAAADGMFALAGTSRQQMNISGLNDLSKKFGEAYSKVYADYQDSISRPIERHVKYDSISVQTVSPALQGDFINKAGTTVVLAVILSFIMVFLFFRSIPPSVAVLTGALADVLMALGAMGLLGIPLTLASFAALLMLIGFSLDTDILLTTRMLKRKGDPRENAFDAMKTGLTMSVMAIIAFSSLFILASVTHIPTYYEISSVALAGLIGDMFATWGINGVLILHFIEKKAASRRQTEGA